MCALRCQLREPFRRARLVIFDKDGTLTHCDSCFGPWIEDLVVKLQRLQLINRPDKFFKYVGYDPGARAFLTDSMLIREPNSKSILRIAEEAWRQTGGTRPLDGFTEDFLRVTRAGPEKNIWDIDLAYLTTETLHLCGAHIYDLFESLHRNGTKVGICTSDDRYLTTHTLRTVKLDQYFRMQERGDSPASDDLACADDEDIGHKPLPDGVQKLCRLAQVPTDHTIMVGDSFSDMVAGLRAGCRELVFVESGGLRAEDLEEHLRSDAVRALPEADDWGVCQVLRIPPRETHEATYGKASFVGAMAQRKIYAMASVDDMLE